LIFLITLGSETPAHLQYIYMMRFILTDQKDSLLANIWQSDAVCTFHSHFIWKTQSL